MSKSFISYEFSPAERLLLLRGIHLMLSDLYEEIYFFGFYNDENQDDNNSGNNVLGFISSQDEEEEEEETEESNFFEDSNQYKYDFLGDEDKENKDEPEEKDSSFTGFFDDDDDNDDFDELFDDDWQVDRDQMEKLITEIKILENKLLNIDSEEDFPELDINELEILLDSAYEVKIQIEEEEEMDWEEDSDTDPDSDPTQEEIRDAINKLANEDRKQIEEDYEYLVLKQHKDLSSLIYKIKEWIDNYQINSN